MGYPLHQALPIPCEGDRAVRKLLGLVVLVLFASTSAAADVDELIKKLGNRDNEVRRSAANDLRELGKDAKPAIKALTKALRDRDLFVRRWSAEALGKIGPDAKDAIPELSKLLNDRDKAVRQSAVKAIGQMGEAGVPALARALKGGTSDVKENAVNALGEVGPVAVPALSDAIRDVKMDSALRRKAIESVLKQGNEARKAIPALVAALKNPRGVGARPEVFRFGFDVVDALGRLATKDDAAAISVLEGLVKNPKVTNKPLKNRAAKALEQIKARAE
jgi:HEAT repeat protein